MLLRKENDMKYYTVGEVAEICRYTEYYIRKLLREGVIVGTKFGRDWRIEEDDLKKYLKGEK